MVELNNIASIFETALNDNDCGINFSVSTDRGVYDAGRTNIDGFTVPGVVTALTGNYEPLRGLKVYTLPVNLELWCYAALDDEFYKPSYTLEQQKECVSAMVEALNGTTQVIDGDAVIFTGTTVTVGAPNNNGGGGCTRIPVLVQVVLTAVEGAVLSNDIIIKINGEQVVSNSFVVNYVLSGELQSTPLDTTAKSIPTTQSRTFSGSFFLYDSSEVLQSLKTQLLSGLAGTFVLTFDNIEFIVYAQQITESLAAGQIVVLNVTFVEAYGIMAGGDNATSDI